MHENQEKILKLAGERDLSKMSFREMGRLLGIKEPQTVIYHLKKLRDKNMLYFDSAKKQRVAKPRAFMANDFFNIPVLGSANCGQALELAQQNILGFLKISPKILERKKPDQLYVVKAVGDSMNEAENIKGGPIDDGDYVVVDHADTSPKNGDYVLSIIDGAANIKRFYKERKEIRLVSESKREIPPIVLHADDLDNHGYLVSGVVVRVIKN